MSLCACGAITEAGPDAAAECSAAPSSASAAPNPICDSGSTTLSVSGGTLGDGASWQWYSGSCGGTPVGAGDSISVSPTSATTYYVRAEGACEPTACAEVTVDLDTSTAPSGAMADPAVVCDGSATTLSVTGGTLGDGASWQWYSGSCGGTQEGTGASISVSPTSTTTYYVRAEGACEPTACASVQVTVDPCPLYAFQEHTFTNCGQTGPTGPSEAACEETYGTPWSADDAFFSVAAGIQSWVVPVSGTYRIRVAGAGHTNGSQLQLGAVMTGEFELERGDVLQILVGQMATGIDSGSGGTFVEHASAGLLIAAGGSGGICSASQAYPEVQASVTETAQSGNTGEGGTAGNGGQSGCDGSPYGGGGGGGYLTDGDNNDTTYGCPGFSFASGGAGGTDSCGGTTSSEGGFGGGGAGFLNCEPAAGGGYSGGGGGGANNVCGGSAERVGGGGGSFNAGANQESEATHQGHGYATITPL